MLQRWIRQASVNRVFALALLVLVAAPAGAATVLSVGDGDTMRVSDGGKRTTIRLACIDAPETGHRPYGEASRQRLQQLAPVGSVVSIRPQTQDKYGRTVAEVFRNGQSLNFAMVSEGQAFAYRKYLAACDQTAYLRAEKAAQRQGLGVWSVPGGITRPWEWRKGSALPPPSVSNPSLGGPGRRYTCQEIGSRARAQQLLREGHTYLDRNNDGIACDSLR
jgi:endonuclease YncB( thermonuclease family)